MRRILLSLSLCALSASISFASGHAIFYTASFGDSGSVSLNLAEVRPSHDPTFDLDAVITLSEFDHSGATRYRDERRHGDGVDQREAQRRGGAENHPGTECQTRGEDGGGDEPACHPVHQSLDRQLGPLRGLDHPDDLAGTVSAPTLRVTEPGKYVAWRWPLGLPTSAGLGPHRHRCSSTRSLPEIRKRPLSRT